MACIEIVLLFFTSFLLRKNKTSNPASKKWIRQIFTGYAYCLKKPSYVVNMLFVGINMTLIVRFILGSAHQVYVSDFHFSSAAYTLMSIGFVVLYVLGIMVFLLLPERAFLELLRAISILIFLFAAIWLLLSHSLLSFIISIYLICFALGFHAPLATSSGLESIKSYYGAAAALFTFSFSLISALWSFVLGEVHVSMETFLAISMLVAAVMYVVLAVSLLCFKLK